MTFCVESGCLNKAVTHTALCEVHTIERKKKEQAWLKANPQHKPVDTSLLVSNTGSSDTYSNYTSTYVDSSSSGYSDCGGSSSSCDSGGY